MKHEQLIGKYYSPAIDMIWDKYIHLLIPNSIISDALTDELSHVIYDRTKDLIWNYVGDMLKDELEND